MKERDKIEAQMGRMTEELKKTVEQAESDDARRWWMHDRNRHIDRRFREMHWRDAKKRRENALDVAAVCANEAHCTKDAATLVPVTCHSTTRR